MQYGKRFELMYFASIRWDSVQNSIHHFDGLVQKRRNSITNALSYAFLALSHWYDRYNQIPDDQDTQMPG